MIPVDLRRRAADVGVQLSYEDVDQVEHAADPDVLRPVIETLEADRADHRRRSVPAFHDAADQPVVVAAAVRDATLLVDGVRTDVEVTGDGDTTAIRLPSDLPVGCHTLSVDAGTEVAETLVVVAPPTMPDLDARRRWSALFAPAYALWEPESPLPSYAHVGSLAAALERHGVDLLATLPIYATFLDDPFDPSPYSPVSRLHWNEAYLDDTRLPSVATPTEPAATPPATDDETFVDWRALGARRRGQLVGLARDADDRLRDELDRYRLRHPDVGAYARFRAGRNAGGDPAIERSYVLGQMLCDRELRELRDRAGSVGLSLDLPIGSHPDGYETWAHPTLFASSTAVGAPPDPMFAGGQNWGFPPQLPGAMRSGGYDLWRRMIERAGEHCDLLRIDHVMAVHRLWWIPDGAGARDGVYVRYPRDELLAVIAATAAAAGVAVVGENLGTVPPEVDAALRRWGMLGMYEEQFHTTGRRLGAIPERTVAGVRTHDMPAFAAHVADHDLSDYAALLGTTDGDSKRADVLFDAALARLLASDARAVVADIDDLLGEARPHNLPGRVVPGIWQRRLDRPLSETLRDPNVTRRLDLMGERT